MDRVDLAHTKGVGGMKTPKKQYQERQARYGRLLRNLKVHDRRLGNLRLVVFFAGFIATIALHYLGHRLWAAFALALATALFFYLVLKHEELSRRIKYTSTLLDINVDSLKRLWGQWKEFLDNGEDFQDDDHGYTGDLDIFGPDSLFQWTNTAKTYYGRHMLRDLLGGEIGDREEVLARQEAVKELAPMLAWRQDFIAEAMVASAKLADPDKIIAWAKEGNPTFCKGWVRALVKIFPGITGILALAGFAFNLIPWSFPVLALLLQFALLAYKGKDREKLFGIAENYAGDLRSYYKMLQILEEQEFQAPLLRSLKLGLKGNGKLAYVQVGRLSRIIDSLANRRNAFYLIFNTVTLWDFQIIVALEGWKQQSGIHLQSWLRTLGKLEALNSLALICFDNPEWTMPRLSIDSEPLFKAMKMGHPLLPPQRVPNDLFLDKGNKVLLITGSNMSGKSTYLRTAGINLVLAYAGGPVCAEGMEVAIMEILTCMRIRDNLGENISSFYAELLRIKEIVRATQAGNKVFFLLDEVFKGTNSRDRHTGAKVLTNKLSTTNSIGLVSTHDLELCELEGGNERVANYHFQEYYRDGQIHFDYKLRPGPSRTRNALYLMRLAGIEIEGEGNSQG